MSLSQAIDQLNPQQQEAVISTEGPHLIIAGAGSGKTRVVTLRVAHLIEKGVPASQILAVTFTNKAAREMKHRIESLVDREVWVSTFHRLGLAILREDVHHLGYNSNFHIYDSDDQQKMIRSIMADLNISGKDYPVKALQSWISGVKNEGIVDLDDLSKVAKEEPLNCQIFEAYQKRMNLAGALDFDDLIALPLRLFKEHPDVLTKYRRRWQYIHIDEYQDTNPAQHEMMTLLSSGHCNLFVVGDPDQSIYSWRGACIQNILSFESLFESTKVIRLEENYRSTRTILDAANALIENNTQRYRKSLKSTLGPGSKIKYFEGFSEDEEARFISERIHSLHRDGINYSDIVIFYRTNFQSRVIEDELLFADIPYQVVGGVSFYQRKEVKDMLAFCRLITQPNDFLSFARALQVPKRGIGDKTVSKMRQLQEIRQTDFINLTGQMINETSSSLGFRLNKTQKDRLYYFHRMLVEMIEFEKRHTVAETIEKLIEEIGYIAFLHAEDPDSASDRELNVLELVAKAKKWEEGEENPTLKFFLDDLSLRTDIDQESDDVVQMMTLHHGKGLEFDYAFIAGLEDSLLPHFNSLESPEKIEEERRLLYVGITRAKIGLHLSHSSGRFLWGQSRLMRPSRFLRDIPKAFLQRVF